MSPGKVNGGGGKRRPERRHPLDEATGRAQPSIDAPRPGVLPFASMADGGNIMRKALLILLSSALIHGAAQAGPVEDATSAVTTVLDRFNAGDVDAFFAAHQADAIIVDEFAPFVWTGSGSAQRWAADYMRDAGTRGISEGRIDYSAPIQANGDAATAYIVLPTTYRFQQRGARMAGRGNMTFVMRRDGERWTIASWTYAGSTPAPE